jgi:PAS domain S-box-containing protein
MGYKFSEVQKQVLDLLASGYSERETYLHTGIGAVEFSKVWDAIRLEIESSAASNVEEMDLRHAYHRVERRRLESELWASEARLAALMDISPEAILLINGRTGQIEQINNQAQVLFGYTKRELIGQAMEMLLEDDIKEIHVSYRQGFLNSVRKREMGYHPPIRAVAKDGRSIQLEIALTATAATDDVMVVCKPIRPLDDLPIGEKSEGLKGQRSRREG